MAGSRPTYIVRAKEDPTDPNNKRHVTIGAVWPFKEGEGFVMKLNLLPVKFDGSLLLVVPKDDDQQ